LRRTSITNGFGSYNWESYFAALRGVIMKRKRIA